MSIATTCRCLKAAAPRLRSKRIAGAGPVITLSCTMAIRIIWCSTLMTRDASASLPYGSRLLSGTMMDGPPSLWEASEVAHGVPQHSSAKAVGFSASVHPSFGDADHDTITQTDARARPDLTGRD